MAINAIEVYPTCEIHLLRSIPTPMSVIVRERWADSERNLLQVNDCLVQALEFNSEGLDLVDVDIDHQSGLITFSPNPNNNDTGSTIGRIRNTHGEGDNAVVTEILVRVFVHDDIDQYWIGNSEVTIHEGADNYVLSVYATFNDTTTPVDISSHPYIDFSSTDPTKVTIDDHQDKGRIQGKAQTNDNPVQLQVQIGAGPVREVDAQVIEPLSTPKPILRCISGSAQVEGRENILFIAEGFIANQKDIFEALAHKVSNQLFTNRGNSPYNLLKDKFNVWIAFEPSPQEGASIMRPIKPSSGKLLKVNANNDPFFQPNHVLVQATNNKHGLSYGYRYGDQTSKVIADVNDPPDTKQWCIPRGTTRTLLNFDRRRLPRHWKAFSAYDDYFNVLQVDPTVHSGAQYDHLSDVWKSLGRNNSLVCWLVNDDLSSADNQGGDIYGIKASVKHYSTLAVVPSSGLLGVSSRYRHVLRPLALKHSITLSNMYIEVTKVEVKGTSIPAVTSTIAHELGHSLGLGDAYETGANTTLLEGDTGSQSNIEGFANLTHFWRIRDNDNNETQIDLDQVVWNQWHRINVGATLTSLATNTGNNTIQFQVKPVDALVWDLKDNQPNQKVFLRTRLINFDTKPRGYIEGPFTLNSINVATGAIELSGIVDKTFPPGSVLYNAKEIDGKPISLIHPKVVDFFNDPGKNNKVPFAEKDPNKNECNIPNLYASAAPVIPDFSVTNRQYLVAVYEGGGDHNCKVYRPSGQCRMRNDKSQYDDVTPPVFPAFCPVCKYHLVNKINPSKLADVDQEYPS